MAVQPGVRPDAIFRLPEARRRRRDDADFNGYQFWLGKLNEFGGDYIRAGVVKAFISSLEYQRRSGPSNFDLSK